MPRFPALFAMVEDLVDVYQGMQLV
jgi:hypothetical protein